MHVLTSFDRLTLALVCACLLHALLPLQAGDGALAPSSPSAAAGQDDYACRGHDCCCRTSEQCQLACCCFTARHAHTKEPADFERALHSEMTAVRSRDLAQRADESPHAPRTSIVAAFGCNGGSRHSALFSASGWTAVLPEIAASEVIRREARLDFAIPCALRSALRQHPRTPPPRCS